MTDPLLGYIEKELNKGFSEKDVLEKLVATGYKKEKIQSLLQELPKHHAEPTKFELVIAVIVILLLIVGAFFMITNTESSDIVKKEDTTLKVPEEMEKPKEFYTEPSGISRLTGS